MIIDTVDRLQSASACENDVGDRYSRLIRLLWRKRPTRASIAEGPIDFPRSTTAQPSGLASNGNGQTLDPALFDSNDVNAFSWRDLSAIGDFALTNNEGIVTGLDSVGFDQISDSPGSTFTGFDPSMVVPPQYWNAMSPSGIIF